MSEKAAPKTKLPVFVNVEQDLEDDVHSLALKPLSKDTVEDEPATDENPTVEEASTTDNNVETGFVHSAKLVAISYIGNASVYIDDQFRFRRGEPVFVPSDIAEKLLRNRQERFEAVKE